MGRSRKGDNVSPEPTPQPGRFPEKGVGEFVSGSRIVLDELDKCRKATITGGGQKALAARSARTKGNLEYRSQIEFVPYFRGGVYERHCGKVLGPFGNPMESWLSSKTLGYEVKIFASM